MLISYSLYHHEWTYCWASYLVPSHHPTTEVRKSSSSWCRCLGAIARYCRVLQEAYYSFAVSFRQNSCVRCNVIILTRKIYDREIQRCFINLASNSRVFMAKQSTRPSSSTCIILLSAYAIAYLAVIATYYRLLPWWYKFVLGHSAAFVNVTKLWLAVDNFIRTNVIL